MSADTCRSCGAAILWGTTEKGKRTPLDAKPITGPIYRLEPPLAIPLEREGPAYRSHFETCPDAKDWTGKTRDDQEALL